MADRAKEARVSAPSARHDREADALYVRLREGPAARTEELDDFRNVDYDADGRPIGIEFLAASRGVDLRDVPEAAIVAAALRGLPVSVRT
jgi:uncharacterized protein YuzE